VSLELFAARPLPEWYEDAKLGIMIHWGPYAVPAWAPSTGELPRVIDEHGWEYWFANNPYAEWYANTMLISGSPTQRHHRATWGRLARYDAFARTFRQGMKDWDPSQWIEPILSCRARYVVVTAKPHDGFLMWPARRRNPRKGGWQLSRDIIGEIASAARERGLRLGVYYSAGLDWTFGGTPIRNLDDLVSATPRARGYAAYVDAHWRELIARYKPSILWNDIGSPRGEDLRKLLSLYYDAVPDGVVNDRFGQSDLGESRSIPHRVAMALARVFAPRPRGQPTRRMAAPAGAHADVRTLEYAAAPSEHTGKWECVRGLGYSFGCTTEENEENMLSVPALVRLLVDVVARGGNLLLGVGPRSDGSLSAAQLARMNGLGNWLKVNGEAIFGTRPWGEADSVTEEDIEVRYTCKGMTVYAILLGTPAGRTIVMPGLRLLPYAGVRILGSLSYVTWFEEGKDIHIRLSEPLRESAAHVISITPQPRT
jgi:alpha-L-fucosidase